MNANANIVKLEKGTSNLVRPRFSPGLLLRDDDLRTGVDYTRELSRLLFRSLFGCGVVCGLEVEVGLKCGKLVVTINPGVALNGCGDPIHVPDPVQISVDPTCGEKIPAALWVILCRTEKCCAPRSTVCGCEEEDSASVCTREREGFEIRLLKEMPEEKCICRCDERAPPARRSAPEASECWCADPCSECYAKHYQGLCECECCDPDCVLLAVLRQAGEADLDIEADGETEWVPNHSVRRFVRPVLMRDPVVFRERAPEEFDPCNRVSSEQMTAAYVAADTQAEVRAAKKGVAAKRIATTKQDILKVSTKRQAKAKTTPAPSNKS
jgi:hypothetical protein